MQITAAEAVEHFGSHLETTLNGNVVRKLDEARELSIEFPDTPEGLEQAKAEATSSVRRQLEGELRRLEDNYNANRNKIARAHIFRNHDILERAEQVRTKIQNIQNRLEVLSTDDVEVEGLLDSYTISGELPQVGDEVYKVKLGFNRNTNGSDEIYVKEGNVTEYTLRHEDRNTGELAIQVWFLFEGETRKQDVSLEGWQGEELDTNIINVRFFRSKRAARRRLNSFAREVFKAASFLR